MSKYYVKFLDTGKYTECSFNKDGNLYVIYSVKVQRGMGHQKANEVLIVGMNKKFIDRFLEKENAIIVERDEPPENMLILDSYEGKNLGEKL